MRSAASVERYLRRHVHKASYEIFVTCLPGLEHDTKNEVAELLPRHVPTLQKGGVTLQGALHDAYRLNIGLSTASRVLIRIGMFKAWTLPMLFDHVGRAFWPAYIPDAHRVEVRVVSHRSRLNMKRRIESTVRAAIEKSLADTEAVTGSADSTIMVRIVDDEVTLSLDTSGLHLHKRGDKRLTDIAPLRSTVAAAALRQVQLETRGVVCDPFCGSGTILMEAQRMTAGLAPGAHRSFAFMDHPYFKPSTWRQILRDDQMTRMPIDGIAFVGGDSRGTSVQTARQNLAGLVTPDTDADIEERDFRQTIALAGARHERGAVVTNPPFGVRVGDSTGARRLQQDLADLIEDLPSWTFALVTPFPDLFERRERLKIERATPLRIGGIRATFLHGHTLGSK